MNLLYSKFKIFHFKDKIDSLTKDVDQIKSPIHIRIKPTNICGHNCWYCSYKAETLQLGQDMVERDSIPRGKMMEIIDDIIEMGVKAVTFSGGGDPFYYPHLVEAVRKLVQSPVKFASLHNGSRLQGELAELFAFYATWLRISIDGWDDKSYAEYRGVPMGEFSKVMSNLNNFNKLGGKCNLGISLIIDQKNASHIYEFTKRLKDVGVNSVKMSACVVDDDVRKNNAYHKNIFQTVKEQVCLATEKLSDDTFEIYDAYHELEGKFKKEYTWCPYLQILPVIGADLNIYPCQDKAYNLKEGVIGSIREQRFKDFWFQDKGNYFKVNPTLHCNHHCVANDKNRMVLEYLNTDKTHSVFV